MPEPKPRQPEKSEDQPIVWTSTELFQGRQEVVIEHEGVQYRLRITKKGKLLLQK